MNKNKFIHVNFSSWTFSDWSLNWIIFFSIFYQKLVPIGFLFWIIFSYKDWKLQTIKSFFKTIYTTPGFWFLLYYLLLVVGMTWTDNIEFGFSKLENKLSFVLLPILLVSTRLNSALGDWKNTFISALVISVIFYEIMATIHTLNSTHTSPYFYFRESNFTLFMHRSYFACYLVIGFILILEKLWDAWSYLGTALLCLFFIAIFQTFSKAGIGSFMIIIVLFAIFKLYKKSIYSAFTVIGLVLFSSFFILSFENLLSLRFKNMIDAIENTPLRNNHSVESNASRILMWSASAEVVKENPMFGVGTGDYDDALANKNKKFNNTGVYKERLNSHSQFLNTWVQLGFIGFGLLAMMFIVPMTGSYSIYKILILITFFLNFLFESFLETQAGIILFCLFFMLLFSPKSVFNNVRLEEIRSDED